MSFLKPEPKPFTWKSIMKSEEFKRLAFMILLMGIIIAFMVILVLRWGDLFPAPADKAKAISSEESPVTPAKITTITPTAPSTTPTLSAPTSITLTPPTLIPEFFEGRLDNVKDSTPAKQDEAFNFLLEQVSELTPEEITERIAPNIKFEDLMDHPKEHRGKFIRVKGQLIISPQPYNLATNPAGLKIYYTGWLGNANKGEIYHFVLIDKPEKYVGVNDRQRWADMVWVEGSFLKLERYELDVGGYRIAPCLIGRSMGKVPVSLKGITMLQFVMGGLIALAFIVIIMAIVISARKDKAYQIRRRQKLQKLVETKTDKPDSPQDRPAEESKS